MNILKEVYQNRKIIMSLSKNDFKNRYSGSIFGIVWGFIPPIMTILIYWFIFNIGFRVIPIDGVPYLLWLVAGLVPWFFFAEAITSATNSFIEYSYLVKKVVFKVSMIPLVKVISIFFVHIFFLCVIMYIFLMHGYTPRIINLQIFYYSFCLFVLVVSISFITASINVFFRDTTQIIMVFLQIGIWMSPIMWNINMFPVKYVKILKLNPLYYIIQGYRDSLIYGVSLTKHVGQGVYFWVITLSLFIIGAYLFKKLKPHFADLL